MKDIIKTIEDNTDFIVSWKAIKYNKTIFRVGNLNKEGCRVWEKRRQEIYVLLGYSFRKIYDLH